MVIWIIPTKQNGNGEIPKLEDMRQQLIESVDRILCFTIIGKIGNFLIGKTQS